MSDKRLILLTNTWPYNCGETFLDTEAKYLSGAFEIVEVFPLYSDGFGIRPFPSNFSIHKPALHRNPKQKATLLMQGIFSTAPLCFAIKELFTDKCFKPEKFWNLCTSALTFRASYSALSGFGICANDIVYSYWGDKWAVALPFIKASSGCKCVARFHGSDLYEEVKGYIPFRKKVLASLDAAFPISEVGARYLKDRYGFSTNVHVARLGVNKAETNPPSIDNTFKIISCSNAIPLKRLDIIAKAISLIDFQIQWTHIGDGPTLESVREICSDSDTRFLGRLSNEQVKSIYSSEHFDLFVNVSSSEGVPVSIMEAFAQGIPVIATNVGGTGEIVDSTVGALLPANVTPEMLANAITEFSQADTTQIKGNALERWNNMCNADENYEAFTHLLTTLPSSRTERGGCKI